MTGKWRAETFGAELRHGVLKRPLMVPPCGYRGISVDGATELRYFASNSCAGLILN